MTTNPLVLELARARLLNAFVSHKRNGLYGHRPFMASIIGRVGEGKTRLAQAFARALEERGEKTVFVEIEASNLRGYSGIRDALAARARGDHDSIVLLLDYAGRVEGNLLHGLYHQAAGGHIAKPVHILWAADPEGHEDYLRKPQNRPLADRTSVTVELSRGHIPVSPF